MLSFEAIVHGLMSIGMVTQCHSAVAWQHKVTWYLLKRIPLLRSLLNSSLYYYRTGKERGNLTTAGLRGDGPIIGKAP